MNKEDLLHTGEVPGFSLNPKEAESAEIQSQIDEFIANGGVIEHVSYNLKRTPEEISRVAKAHLGRRAVPPNKHGRNQYSR